LPQIYEEFYHTINNADHNKDLKWWSNNHGVIGNQGQYAHQLILMNVSIVVILGEHGDGMAGFHCEYP
jgi:hypothetical protein